MAATIKQAKQKRRSDRPAASQKATVRHPLGFRKKLGFTAKEFSRLIGFSERAIAEWEAGKPVSEPARRRLEETQRLLQALEKLVDVESAPDWFKTPNPAFGGLKPLEVIERGEIDRLWRMVFFLESGVPT